MDYQEFIKIGKTIDPKAIEILETLVELGYNQDGAVNLVIAMADGIISKKEEEKIMDLCLCIHNLKYKPN